MRRHFTWSRDSLVWFGRSTKFRHTSMWVKTLNDNALNIVWFQLWTPISLPSGPQSPFSLFSLSCHALFLTSLYKHWNIAPSNIDYNATRRETVLVCYRLVMCGGIHEICSDFGVDLGETTSDHSCCECAYTYEVDAIRKDTLRDSFSHWIFEGRLILGTLLNLRFFPQKKGVDLYMGSTNTRVYTVVVFYIAGLRRVPMLLLLVTMVLDLLSYTINKPGAKEVLITWIMNWFRNWAWII